MLAFSGVAHAGFIMSALVAGDGGIPAMWFYVATYAVSLVGAFTVVSVVSGPRAERSPFEAYQGLAADRRCSPPCSPCSCSASPGSR